MFGVKSLDQIQSTFTKAIDDLAILINKNAEEVAGNTKIIQHLESSNGSLLAESQKAYKFQQKLEDLVGE